MKISPLFVGLALCVVPSTSSPEPAVSPEQVPFRCTDLVVVGRFKNSDWQRVEIKDDILGHGWATARVKVRRVLAGKPPRGALIVRYFGHTYFTEDRDFLLVIEPTGSVTNRVVTARLTESQPELAKACS